MTRPSILALAFIALVAGPAMGQTASRIAAQPAEVRVFASTGLRSVLETVQADASKAVGHAVTIQFGSSRALKDVIESERPFELAIVTPEVLDGAIAKGTVRAGTRRDVARTMVALAQRGGTPGPIAQPERLKTLLAGAKAIRFNPIGSGKPTIDKMFAGLSIDPASLGARVRPLPTKDDPPATLGPGEYELTIVLDSEVPQLAPGAVNLGPIPAPFQIPVVMSAGVGAKGDAKLAGLLLGYLEGPAVTKVLNANRMTRP